MEQLDADQLYDPNMRQVPKVKQIFKISKEHNRSLSCVSSHNGSDYVKPLLLGGEPTDMGVHNKNDLINLRKETATISKILPLGQIFNRQPMSH